MLMGEEFSITEISEELTPNNLVNLKYACVDVEKSFLKYSNVRPITDVLSHARTCLCSPLCTAIQTEVKFNVYRPFIL
jgi:hypothetical protein